MKMTSSMPISTRLWGAGLLIATVFLGWAFFWPVTAPALDEATRPALPVYAMHAVTPAAAPNTADPAWARPLYFNDRRPRTAVVGQGGGSAANQGFDAVLTGIVRSPDLSLATLSPANGKPVRVKLGDEVEGQPGWRLVNLSSRTATFRNGDREQVLRIEARDVAIGPASPVPPASLPTAPAEASRPPDQAPPPSVPGITGQASTAKPVTSSAPAATATAPANAGQEQQIQAIRRRIEDARRQIRSDAPQPSR